MNVEVIQSGLWQTSSTLLAHGRVCVVVDPAYFPREIDAIVGRAGEIGRVEAVVFTHGHWDHVMGHAAFPGVPVAVSRVLAEGTAAADPRVAGYLEDARRFDSRWYVPRPAGHRWPETLRGLGEGDRFEFGGAALLALHLPGHSPDGLGLLADGVLLVGDYLSPCEMPFIDEAHPFAFAPKNLTQGLARGGDTPKLAHAFGAAPGENADLLIVIAPGVERFEYFRHLERIAYGKVPPQSLLDLQELYDTYFQKSAVWDKARAGCRRGAPRLYPAHVRTDRKLSDRPRARARRHGRGQARRARASGRGRRGDPKTLIDCHSTDPLDHDWTASPKRIAMTCRFDAKERSERCLGHYILAGSGARDETELQLYRKLRTNETIP